MLAVEAVLREPVSSANPCYQGKIQGISHVYAVQFAPHCAETRIQTDSQALYPFATHEAKQGINSGVSGNLTGRTVNFFATPSTAKVAGTTIEPYGGTAAPKLRHQFRSKRPCARSMSQYSLA